MNRTFMEEYYDMKYPDTFLPLAIETDGECRELYEDIMRMEGQAESAMRGIGEECLLLHGQLFAARGKMETLILRLAYLQGAGDREKMLE